MSIMCKVSIKVSFTLVRKAVFETQLRYAVGMEKPNYCILRILR